MAAPPPSAPAQSVLLIFANLGNRLAVLPALTLLPDEAIFSCGYWPRVLLALLLDCSDALPIFLFLLPFFLIDIKELLAH